MAEGGSSLTDPSQRKVYQQVITARLETTHLPQNRRGVAADLTRDGPDRLPGFHMRKINNSTVRHPIGYNYMLAVLIDPRHTVCPSPQKVATENNL
jgi:hypothetical protein